jgi:hypothetical protein
VHTKVKRINSPSFYDEANFEGVILDEAGIDIDFLSEEIDEAVLSD